MSEAEEHIDNKDSVESKKPVRFEYSKRFGITIALLFLFFVVFNHILPRLMVNKQPETQVTKPEEIAKTTEQLRLVQDTVAPVVQEDPRIRELEERIVSLQEKHASEVAELKNKIEQRDLETQSKANKKVSALVAFSQLKDAVNNGKPYRTELNQFVKIVENNPEIETVISELEKHSDSGIITISPLKEKFFPLIDTALAKREQGYWRGVVNKFITIRKIGDRLGDDDESILARAEIRLENNDLRAALKELDGLTQPAKEVFSGWVEDAENILKTEKNLSRLQLLLIPTEAESQL